MPFRPLRSRLANFQAEYGRNTRRHYPLRLARAALRDSTRAAYYYFRNEDLECQQSFQQPFREYRFRSTASRQRQAAISAAHYVFRACTLSGKLFFLCLQSRRFGKLRPQPLVTVNRADCPAEAYRANFSKSLRLRPHLPVVKGVQNTQTCPCRATSFLPPESREDYARTT